MENIFQRPPILMRLTMLTRDTMSLLRAASLRTASETAHGLNLNSEVELDRTSCPQVWKVGWAPVRDQVISDGSNFGEVGICQFKMLSSKGILVFSPPQVSDR